MKGEEEGRNSHSPFFLVYTLAELSKHPTECDQVHLEFYLSDTEFQSVFHLTKNEFSELPKWKQSDLKKKTNLF